MKKFLTDGVTYINTDHIISMSLRGHKVGDEYKYKTVCLLTDRATEYLDGNHLDFDNTTVIPATDGFEVLSFWYPREGNPDTAEINFMIDRVIAWRICNESKSVCPQPITFFGEPESTKDCYVGIRHRDSPEDITVPDEATFESLAAFRDYVREYWKKSKHK